MTVFSSNVQSGSNWLLEVSKEVHKSLLDCCDVLRVRDCVDCVRCSNLGTRNVIESRDSYFGWRMGVGEVRNL